MNEKLRKSGHTFLTRMKFEFKTITNGNEEKVKMVTKLHNVGLKSFQTLAVLSSPTVEIQNILYWVYVDKKSRRKAPLPDWFSEKYSKLAPSTYGGDLNLRARDSFPTSKNQETLFAVEKEHIDHFGHLSNHYYIQCAVEAAENILNRQTVNNNVFVKSLEVLFVKESLLGDHLKIETGRDGMVFTSVIKRLDKPLAFVRIECSDNVTVKSNL